MEEGGGEGAESIAWDASDITWTGIDVNVVAVSLLVFDFEVSFEGLFAEAKEGGIIDIGERGIESGTGLAGLEDNDADADDNDDEASISGNFFFVSSWNKPPVADFFAPYDTTNMSIFHLALH